MSELTVTKWNVSLHFGEKEQKRISKEMLEVFEKFYKAM